MCIAPTYIANFIYGLYSKAVHFRCRKAKFCALSKICQVQRPLVMTFQFHIINWIAHESAWYWEVLFGPPKSDFMGLHEPLQKFLRKPRFCEKARFGALSKICRTETPLVMTFQSHTINWPAHERASCLKATYKAKIVIFAAKIAHSVHEYS